MQQKHRNALTITKKGRNDDHSLDWSVPSYVRERGWWERGDWAKVQKHKILLRTTNSHIETRGSPRVTRDSATKINRIRELGYASAFIRTEGEGSGGGCRKQDVIAALTNGRSE